MSVFHSELGKEEIGKILGKPGAALFFIGIGGESMCGLAALSLSLGYRVSGSDREERPAFSSLRARGAALTVGHRAENLNEKTDLVVYTLAIGEENPEFRKAKEAGIPAVSRAELLGVFADLFETSVGVSGSHGKSGTVALLSEIFGEAKLRPTVLSGASLKNGENYLPGGRELLVFEGCEYRDSFLRFSPSYLVLLNLEWDHADYFPDPAALERSFLAAADRTRRAVIYNADDERLSRLMKKCKTKTYAVGRRIDADFCVGDVTLTGGFCRYRLSHGGKTVELAPGAPGAFQVENSALAAACGWLLGVPFDVLSSAVCGFRGIGRRLERRNVGGRPCIYDYAHHPTEIAAGIDTVRQMTGGRVSVVFSPHTFTRTAAFFDGFAASLGKADEVYLTEIYPARESPILGVTSRALAEAIGEKARVITPSDRKDVLKNAVGTLIFMGAGDLSAYL